MERDDVAVFFERHNFFQPDVKNLTEEIRRDMENGLKNPSRLSENEKSHQPMLVASCRIPESLKKNSFSIVIDAGGTNFRSCLVSVDEKGIVSISHMEKTRMPGIEKELSRRDFYDAIAANLDHLKGKVGEKKVCIGFCFSYAMEITPDGDGKILVFSKEIKAPEAVGSYVGMELKAALARRGWNNIEKIILLNDTTASLLAGVAASSAGKEKFSSYIGFILGTGINNAYIECNPSEKIAQWIGRENFSCKSDGWNQEKSGNVGKAIIVCECGMFGKLAQSDFDRELDESSANPGASKLEKMCSGAYLGGVAKNALLHACKDGLFSEYFCREFKKIADGSDLHASGNTDKGVPLMPVDMDDFLKNPCGRESRLGKCIFPGEEEGTVRDQKNLEKILCGILERAARIVAAVLSASVLKSGMGREAECPVCIEANGSTFWKAYGLHESISSLLEKNLSGDWQRYYKILQVENDIVLGTAVAAGM